MARQRKENRGGFDPAEEKERNGQDREGSFSFTGFADRDCPRAEGACARKSCSMRAKLHLDAESVRNQRESGRADDGSRVFVLRSK